MCNIKKIPAIIMAGLAMIIVFSATNLSAKEIPAEVLAKIASFTNVEMSPDGNYIASLRPVNGRKYLVIESIDPDIKKTTSVFNPAEATVGNYMWLNDDRLAVSVYYNRTHRGAAYREWRLLAVGKDGKNIINLAKGNGGRAAQATLWNIKSILPNDADNILVQVRELENALRRKNDVIAASVYKVNVNSGKRKKVARGQKNINDWYADIDGNVRLGYGIVGTSMKVVMRGKGGGGWKTMARFDSVTGNVEYDVEGFSPDENIIYVGSAVGGAHYAFYKYDLAKQAFGEQLFGKENIPVTGIKFDRYTGKIDGYYYTEHEQKTHYVNKRLRSIQRFLDKQFPDTNNSIESYNRDKTRFIIKVSGPKFAGELMFFDIKTKQMMVISELFGGIDLNDLSDMVPVSYKARDGLEIPSYLSLPPDREAKNLPTIILPHGGPIARDVRGFDQWVQFLTSRGYAVLQMNYRGSSGYGRKFRDLGIQQWGRAMQDDITDGTRWMVEKGYSDPDKICIMGASYGGYSALNGIARESDLYKCAISFAGIGDMRLFIREENKFLGFETFMKYIKNQNHSLTDISPAHNIDKIKAPVLLMHGTLDVRVPFKQGPIFYKKMKKAGKDIKFIKLEGENHFLELEKSKLVFLKEVDKFLKKHLN